MRNPLINKFLPGDRFFTNNFNPDILIYFHAIGIKNAILDKIYDYRYLIIKED